jgi:hypothetical protein
MLLVNAIGGRAKSKKAKGRKTTMKRLSVSLAAMFLVFAAATLPATQLLAQPAAVTDDNLGQAITSAKTPAEHEAIATYYEQEAAEAKKKADLHRRAAESYRKMNIAKPVGMANMCDGVVGMWDKIAADASKLANDHREMAKKAGAQTGQ